MSSTYVVKECASDMLILSSFEFGYIQYHCGMGWSYRGWEQNSYEELPELSTEVTEAEIFQLTLIWDYKLPLEHYIELARRFNNNELKEGEFTYV